MSFILSLIANQICDCVFTLLRSLAISLEFYWRLTYFASYLLTPFYNLPLFDWNFYSLLFVYLHQTSTNQKMRISSLDSFQDKHKLPMQSLPRYVGSISAALSCPAGNRVYQICITAGKYRTADSHKLPRSR